MENTPHDGDVTCNASYRQNHKNGLCFWKRRKFATKWYVTLGV